MSLVPVCPHTLSNRPIVMQQRRARSRSSCQRATIRACTSTATRTSSCATATASRVRRYRARHQPAASGRPQLLRDAAREARTGTAAPKHRARRSTSGKRHAAQPAHPRLRHRRRARARVRPRLHGAHRRDRRRQVDPDRRACSSCSASAATPASCARARSAPRSAPSSTYRRGGCAARGWTSTSSQATTARVLLRRVDRRAGPLARYINGSAATLAQLREAGEKLVDIHGQHEHQSLLQSARAARAARRLRRLRDAQRAAAAALSRMAATLASSAKRSRRIRRDRRASASGSSGR